MNCSNCGKPAKREALKLTQGKVVIASICAKCQENVVVSKIVLRKATDSAICFDGYLPVEMTKGGA